MNITGKNQLYIGFKHDEKGKYLNYIKRRETFVIMLKYLKVKKRKEKEYRYIAPVIYTINWSRRKEKKENT